MSLKFSELSFPSKSQTYHHCELQYTQWLLTALGIWSMVSTNITRKAKVSSLFLVCLILFAIAFTILPCIVFVTVRMTTMRSRLVFFGPLGFRITNLLKYLFMMYRANMLKACVCCIEADWAGATRKDQLVMAKSAELGRKLTKLCAFFMYSSGIFFHVMTFLRPKRTDAFNVTIRPHVLPGYDFIVNSQLTPTYEIIFGINCLCGAAIYTVVIATCNLAAVFVGHVSGQVQVIRLKLLKLEKYDQDFEKSANIGNDIAYIVRCHVKILRFVENVRDLLREICLVEVVHSTTVICWLDFFVLTGWKNSEVIFIVTYILLLISLTFNIFMFCYIGEILKNQCGSVGYMTYMITWHRMPKETISSLSLIIAMARYPCTITAGGMMELTIKSFGYVSAKNHFNESPVSLWNFYYTDNENIAGVFSDVTNNRRMSLQHINKVQSYHEKIRSRISSKQFINCMRQDYFQYYPKEMLALAPTLFTIHCLCVNMSPTSSKKIPKTRSSRKHNACIEHELQYTRWVLKSLGIWSMVSDDTTNLDRIASFILIILNLFAIVFILIPCLLHMLLKETNPRRRLHLVGPIGFRISNILKYFSIMFRVDIIKQCLNHVENDWSYIDSEVEQKLVMNNVNVGRNLTRLCAIFMFSAGVFYHTVMPLLRKKRINAFNMTIRPHAYPGYDFFIDSQASPTYEIIFVLHCIFAVAGYFMTIAACNLAATFVTHICGQVQIINVKLQNLTRCTEKSSIAERIASVIKCHVKVLRLSRMIEKILREICMVEVVASTLIICLLEYYCMTEWKDSETASLITYFLLLTALTFNIFIFCYIGEILKDQCQVVGEITYMVEWYQIPSKNSLKLALIIAMARVPQKITAGGMMELTIQSFGSVIKTSVAYLNILRAMAD
ncbi:uncharacterized protein LOC135173018 [Diachasmimorpha longicaudata]|uniref:uncharacterized protein LOC135173018 n=1 Tax=Diachasmimorpha longicaudata TaxID=58733 RepID=UPI0030B8BDCA